MTTATTKYNGWTNYETWAVNLWIDNDQGSDRYWRECAAEAWAAADGDDRPSYWTRSEAALYALSDRIKRETEEGSPLANESSLYADLMTAALSEVDWQEIADGLLEDCVGYEQTPARAAD